MPRKARRPRRGALTTLLALLGLLAAPLWPAWAHTFEKHPGNPIGFEYGDPGDWDSRASGSGPWVLEVDGTFYLFYGAHNGDQKHKIGRATSTDGVSWINDAAPVLTGAGGGSWDDLEVWTPSVIYDESLFKMWYGGVSSFFSSRHLGYATSADYGVNWTKHPDPVLLAGSQPSWETFRIGRASVLRDGPLLKMWYEGTVSLGSSGGIGYATSTDGINWTLRPNNPVFAPTFVAGDWDELQTELPCVIRQDGRFVLFYQGFGSSGDPDRSALGCAESSDGIVWSRHGHPIISGGGTGAWDKDIGGGGGSVLEVNAELRYYYKGRSVTGSELADETKLGYATDSLTISNVFILGITATGATVIWSTDQPGTSVVEYGLTPALGSQVSDGALVTSHSVNLTGLTPNKLYYFRVLSTNDCGLTATSAQGSFTTPAAPNAPPVITCPADITVGNDPGECSAVVDPGTAVATDDSPGVTVAGDRDDDLPLGDPYPVGVTVITWIATNAAGSQAACTQKVTVEDTEAPVIACPADMAAVAQDSAGGATVNFDVPASDNCPGVSVVCNPPSGSLFPLGTTVVNCVATDAAGNTASCSFSITVAPPPSTLNAKVTGGGSISVTGGTATFGMVEMTKKDGVPKGHVTFHDHALGKELKSTVITSLVIDGTKATIFGKAMINGVGEFDFMIVVEDLGEPGSGVDKFLIEISDGYNAGGTVLAGGNIQIH